MKFTEGPTVYLRLNSSRTYAVKYEKKYKIYLNSEAQLRLALRPHTILFKEDTAHLTPTLTLFWYGTAALLALRTQPAIKNRGEGRRTPTPLPLACLCLPLVGEKVLG